MSRKRLMTSLKLSIGQKMLRIRKTTLEKNSKIGKLPVTLATLNFQESSNQNQIK